jgi:hypothetical protein
VGRVVVFGIHQWRNTLSVTFSVLFARMCRLTWMPVLLRFLIQYPAKFQVLIGSVLRLHLIPAPCYWFCSNSIISDISGLFLWSWGVLMAAGHLGSVSWMADTFGTLWGKWIEHHPDKEDVRGLGFVLLHLWRLM